MTRLGRGLNELIPTTPENVDNTTGITTVKTALIRSNTYQPRRHFDPEKLAELSRSIEENGIIQPIIVTKRDNTDYELISGERRLEAAKLAGMEEVPVIVRSVSRREQLLFAIVENVQREDLNPIEEAEGYRQLRDDFKLTQQRIAEVVGKDRATVANLLRLLNLAPPVIEMIRSGALTQGHARAILQVDPEDQEPFAAMIVQKELSVRDAEHKARNYHPDVEKAAVSTGISRDVNKPVERDLEHRYGVRVRMAQRGDRGKISFHFRNMEERNILLQKLGHIPQDGVDLDVEAERTE